jgi:hypothetical protein
MAMGSSSSSADPPTRRACAPAAGGRPSKSSPGDGSDPCAGIRPITLRPSLPKPIPGPVNRLGIHGVDHDAVVKQEVHTRTSGMENQTELRVSEITGATAQRTRGHAGLARADITRAVAASLRGTMTPTGCSEALDSLVAGARFGRWTNRAESSSASRCGTSKTRGGPSDTP